MHSLTAADLSRIEALARAATPGKHAWVAAADVATGEVRTDEPTLSSQFGLRSVAVCSVCGLRRGIRGDSSTVVRYLATDGTLAGGHRLYPDPVTPPCATAVTISADTVLALVEAARRGMEAPVVIAYCPPEPTSADDGDD